MSTITRVPAHKRAVVAFWVILTIAGLASAGPASKAFKQKFSVPGREGRGLAVRPLELVAPGPSGQAPGCRVVAAAPDGPGGGGGIAAAGSFSACTRLSGGCGIDAAAVEAGVESVRRRWNQHRLEARIRASPEPGGVVVRYRLHVPPGLDPAGVHAAFRSDLDQALDGLAAPAPQSWDLAEMADALRLAPALPAGRAYSEDPDHDWSD